MSQVSASSLIAGRYRLDSQVAADPFAEVWRGTDAELARPVAIKMLDGAADADAVRQFREGASRAASLSHEGVVRIFDYCEAEPSEPAQRPLLVMEYVDGQSLASRLREGPLEAAQAVDIIAQVAAALHAVHQAGIGHGDLRPEKVLLSRDGAAKLFGFSVDCLPGSAAIGADLRALGILARDHLIEHSHVNSGAVPEQLRASVAELASLTEHERASHPDATAAIAERAADLAARVGRATSAAGPEPPARQPASSRVPAVAPPVPIPPAASAASTLTMAGLASPGDRPMVSPVGQRPIRRGTQKLPKRRGVTTFRTSAVVAVAVAAVAIFGALKLNGTAQEAKGASDAASVRVTAAHLMGRPVHVVRLRLQRLGLVVRTRWQHSNRVNAGHVLAVRPAGMVPAHSTVVIVGSSGPWGTAAPPGQVPKAHRHHHPSRAPRRTTSEAPTPTPSSSPPSTPTPSPSPTSSPPSGSPSPSVSPSPPSSSPPPSSTPLPTGSPGG